MTTTGRLKLQLPTERQEPQEKSRNHITFLAGMEYFTRIDDNDKHQLYRANENNPVQRDGYRAGARWQCPEHMINDYLFLLGLPATWRRS